MNLFHLDLDKLTYDEIEDFCTRNLPESVRLDYKRTLSSASPQKQVVKAVSALANTQGGLLVFGVGTTPGTKLPDWPSDGMASDPDFERRITRWCIEHIHPPVIPTIGYVENPHAAGKAFGVIRVELSHLTPHTTEGGERIYVRRADNSDPVPATFAEIELLRHQRERAAKLEEEHEADLRKRLGLTTSPSHRSMFLTIRPEFGADDAIPLSDLPGIAATLSRSGFKVGDVRSYSHGVSAVDKPGWSLFTTSRASLGYGLNHGLAGGKRDEPLEVDSLMNWTLLAGKAAVLLADKAGYWGAMEVCFEAYGLDGVNIVGAEPNLELACVDPEIRIRIRWSTTLLRSDPYQELARLLWRIMWSVGLQDHTWSLETIKARLASAAKDRGFGIS